MVNKAVAIIGLSLAFATGVLLNILACALYGNW